MSDSRAVELAERLLDAQVDYVLAELGEERFADASARVLADAFEIAGSMTVGEVLDPGELANSLLVLVDRLGDNTAVQDMSIAFAETVHELPAAADYTLGDVVPREIVSRLVTKVLSMRRVQDRAMDRLTESPVVAGVAATFVNKIVDSFLAGNRARAEKVPGLGGLFAMGDLITDAVRGSAVGQVLTDATSGATQYALQNTATAVREVLEHAPLQDAAMELWDIHAAEPMGAAREAADIADVRELVRIGLDLVASARNSGYVSAVINDCVHVFVANYRNHTVAALLTEFGFDPVELSGELLTHAPAVIAAANRDGLLAARIREQLAPFYASDAVREILAG